MSPPSPALTILDGPMGTELSARGVQTRLPAWSASALDEAPEAVAEVHRAYVDAGARVHTANTFRTQPAVLPDRWERLARRAVRLARAVVPDGMRVAGSVAPVEDCYRPDLSPGEGAREAHRALCRVLADAGADLLLCETFPHLGEAWVAVEEAVATGLPTWLALTAGPSADLLDLADVRRGAEGAVDRGASAVLVNCIPAVDTLRFVEALAGLDVPFGAYANAGAPDDHIGWSASEEPGARAYADLASAWVAAGATLIGGCCGTGPAHVRALAERWGGGAPTQLR